MENDEIRAMNTWKTLVYQEAMRESNKNGIPVYHNEYKDVYYQYFPEEGAWKLSMDPYGISATMYFNGEKYRIDECFPLFLQAYKEATRTPVI
jgi:zona occludens toxin (predicted ATPase)